VEPKVVELDAPAESHPAPRTMPLRSTARAGGGADRESWPSP